MKRWAKDWDHCQDCGTTVRYHKAKGLCWQCYGRQWREAHPGFSKPWKLCNPQKVKAGKRHYNHTHGQAISAYNSQYYLRHQRRLQVQHREYSRTHPLVHRACSRRRRAYLAAVPINDLTHAQWQAVLAHYNHKCVYCGATEDLTQDHIIPLSRGGPHTISNVAPACCSCNSRKGARTPAEAEMYLWQLPLTA